MNNPSNSLRLVLPAFDEQALIESTLREWCRVLDRLDIDFELFLYDDGSRDQTGEIALRVGREQPRIRVVRQDNCGHGPTILRGYREAIGEAEWILQADADAEIPPSALSELWPSRERFDLLIGARPSRSSWSRALVSKGAALAVRALFGSGVEDVNSPFRLLRSDAFEPLLAALPRELFAPNVALSGLAVRQGLRVHELPVPYRAQSSGLVGRRLLGAVLQTAVETVAVARRKPGSRVP